MQRAGVSQSELARRLGIRSQAVNQWLAPGGTAPRGARLHKVAAALGVALSDLLIESIDASADQARTDLLAAYDAMNEEQRNALLIVAKVMVPVEKPDGAGTDPAPAPKRRGVGGDPPVLRARPSGKAFGG